MSPSKYETLGDYHWRSIERRSPAELDRFSLPLWTRYAKVLETLPRGARHVVEAGCGDGALASLMAHRCEKVTGCDLDAAAITHAREHARDPARSGRMRFENKSFEELGIDEDSVDAVVLADVIEHLDHPETILREARRILKPGGSLIMTTPIKKPRGSWDALHVREYTESSIRSLLRDFFPRTRVDRFMPLVLFRTYQRFRFARYAFNSLKLLKMNPFAISIPGMRHVMLRSVSEK